MFRPAVFHFETVSGQMLGSLQPGENPMRTRIITDWPIAVIILGAVASLAWTTFLLWEAADTILAVI
jgi:hypothetical protein